MNNETLALNILALKNISDEELAIAHLALSGFGRITSQMLAYKTMFELGLITSEGEAIDNCLLVAIEYSVQERIKQLDFN